MRFKLNSKEFLRSLSACANAVEPHITIPILGNVLLSAEDDQLHLTTTDLELTIRTRLPVEVLEPGQSTVLAKRLLDYVKLLPDAEMTVSTDDKWYLNATCARSRTRIPGLEPSAFPTIPPTPPPEFSVAVSTLLRLIQGCSYAVPAKQMKFGIPCARLTWSNEGWCMAAADDYRVARITAGTCDETDGILIPLRSLTALPKVFSEVEGGAHFSVAQTDNCLFFSCGSTSVVQRKIHGRFPDFSKVMNAEWKHSIQYDRKGMIGAIERVLGFTAKETKRISLQITADSTTITAESHESGTGQEVLEAGGIERNMYLNGSFLLDFLRANSADQVELQFSEGTPMIHTKAVMDTTCFEGFMAPMS